ncbi:MAG: tetratricopeptide repeat protein [Candidatus Omnitrophota bacterium]
MRTIIVMIVLFRLLALDVYAAGEKDGDYNLIRARKYFEEGKFHNAIKYYDKVLQSNQNDAKMYADLGEAYYETSKYAEAIEYFKKALNIKPDYVRCYYDLTKIYSKLGYSNASSDNYNTAMRVKKEKAEDYYYIGKMINEFDMSPNDAMPFLKKAINLDPGFSKAYCELARSYIASGEPEKAKEILVTLARMDVYSSENQQIKGELCHGTRKSIDYYTKAVEFDPFNINAYILLADSYSILKDYENAKNCCYEAVRNNPDHPDAYYKLAEIYSKTGEYHFSRLNIQKALKLYRTKGDPKMAANAAKILETNSMYFKETEKKAAEK